MKTDPDGSGPAPNTPAPTSSVVKKPEKKKQTVTTEGNQAIVLISIGSDPVEYQARCPHVDLVGVHPDSEAEAVNDLVDQVRKHTRSYTDQGKNAPWKDYSKNGLVIDEGSAIVKKLTGLVPPRVEELKE